MHAEEHAFGVFGSITGEGPQGGEVVASVGNLSAVVKKITHDAIYHTPWNCFH